MANGKSKMKQKIRLGVSGDMGSFSEEAGLLYAERANIEPTLAYLIDMENVLLAVEEGNVDLGIFPVMNFRGGLVSMAFDAMGKHLFTPIDELWLDVQQSLLVQKEMKEPIQHIVSHSQALAQCQQYIQQNFKNAKQVEWEDTAKAARDLAQGLLPLHSAVIAPERSAQVYGLEVIAKNIQQDHPNITIFIVVKKYEQRKA